MKRAILILLITITMTAVVSAQTFTLSLHVNSFTAKNDDFKILYGKGKLLPEAKLSLKLKGNFYLWGSFGLLPLDGYNPILEADITSSTTFISGGISYRMGYIAEKEMALKLEVGLCYIKFKEELPEKIYEASGTGIQGSLGITYGFWKNFFGEISIGYNYAPADIDTMPIRLGGLKISAGIGFFIGKARASKAEPLQE